MKLEPKRSILFDSQLVLSVSILLANIFVPLNVSAQSISSEWDYVVSIKINPAAYTAALIERNDGNTAAIELDFEKRIIRPFRLPAICDYQLREVVYSSDGSRLAFLASSDLDQALSHDSIVILNRVPPRWISTIEDPAFRNLSSIHFSSDDHSIIYIGNQYVEKSQNKIQWDAIRQYDFHDQQARSLYDPRGPTINIREIVGVNASNILFSGSLLAPLAEGSDESMDFFQRKLGELLLFELDSAVQTVELSDLNVEIDGLNPYPISTRSTSVEDRVYMAIPIEGSDAFDGVWEHQILVHHAGVTEKLIEPGLFIVAFSVSNDGRRLGLSYRRSENSILPRFYEKSTDNDWQVIRNIESFSHEAETTLPCPSS